MTDIPFSFGARPPESSEYDRLTNLSQMKPTIGEVAGAYASETFYGVGSLEEDLAASYMGREATYGTKISEDDWKASNNFRDGLIYHEGLTDKSSKVLADRHDARLSNQFIQERASGLQTAVGIGVGFLSGVVEPKNLLSGVAAALVTGGAGAAIPSVGRLIAVDTVKAAAGRGVAEGVVASALTEPLSLSSAKKLQDDYTMADSMMNLALGSVLGAGLGVGGKALELRAKNKQKIIVEAYQAEQGLAVKELDTAIGQTSQGMAVDVASVRQFDNAEVSARARQELPRIEEKIAATGVTKVTELPEFKAWFEGSKVVDDTGMPQVMYHGTTRDFEAFDPNIKAASLQNYGAGSYFATNPADVLARGGREGANIKPVYLALKNPLEITFDDFRAKFGGVEPKEITKRVKAEGYDGIAIKPTIERAADEFVVFDAGNIKSIFNRGKFDPNDPRLIDAERLQVRKGLAESNARIQTDNAPIKKLQDDLAKPDNSTAYNPNDSLDIQKYLDEAGDMEDQIRIEQEFEGMKEELAELKSQGLLNDEELRVLENLSNIDKESAIFDNILLNAKICLTRG